MPRSPLLHFLLLGALLYGLQAASSLIVAPRSVVEVRRSDVRARIERFASEMGRMPDAEERVALEREAVEEALWLEEAWAIGLPHLDPIVQRRLVMNMRFLESGTRSGVGTAHATDEALLQRALELGLAHSDPVVERRLIDRVQARVRDAVWARPIDEAALALHYRETEARWREPMRLDLTHVYLSRDRRGDALKAEARALLARLRGETIVPAVAVAQGDPFLAGHRLRAAAPARLAARLGPVFETGVRDAPVGVWVGPIESAYGLHAVWIHERTPERAPALAAIRPRVVADWREAEARRALRAHLDRRRAAVELRLIDDIETPRTSSASESP